MKVKLISILWDKKKKIKQTKILNSIVDELGKLITNNFFLRRVEEFHYGHYEYY